MAITRPASRGDACRAIADCCCGGPDATAFLASRTYRLTGRRGMPAALLSSQGGLRDAPAPRRPVSRVRAPSRTRTKKGGLMPLATPHQYTAMLDAAADCGYAHAAVNVTSSETLNAALRGFELANADGIVQITVGAAEYLSGTGAKDALLGARARGLRPRRCRGKPRPRRASHRSLPAGTRRRLASPAARRVPRASRAQRRSSLPLAH